MNVFEAEIEVEACQSQRCRKQGKEEGKVAEAGNNTGREGEEEAEEQ